MLAGFPGGSDRQESTHNARDLGSIPGSGERNGYLHPFEKEMATHSVENPKDRGVWWATIHGATKSQTRLSDCPFHFFSWLILGVCFSTN